MNIKKYISDNTKSIVSRLIEESLINDLKKEIAEEKKTLTELKKIKERYASSKKHFTSKTYLNATEIKNIEKSINILKDIIDEKESQLFKVQNDLILQEKAISKIEKDLILYFKDKEKEEILIYLVSISIFKEYYGFKRNFNNYIQYLSEKMYTTKKTIKWFEKEFVTWKKEQDIAFLNSKVEYQIKLYNSNINDEFEPNWEN